MTISQGDLNNNLPEFDTKVKIVNISHFLPLQKDLAKEYMYEKFWIFFLLMGNFGFFFF